MTKTKNIILYFFLLLTINLQGQTGEHPNLFLTKTDVTLIKQNLGNVQLFDKSYKALKYDIDIEIKKPIDVPIPKDPAGGYTHYRHKQNYKIMFGAGILWQISGEKKYAEFVKNMLLKYAKIYPKLPLHPVTKSYARGKLFWQQLNEAVWLVYTSIAYDCIYNYLSEKERNTIEKQLLFPYADFLSIKNPKVFNRIHNHGVWAVAAVGMTGFATGNKELIKRAFDGIGKARGEAGFYVQINKLFSPQGYYTEGPYYERYALTPYILFAQAVNNNEPEKHIFEYRDSVLQKAVRTTLQLTNQEGKFFPFNDAIKEMSLYTESMVNAVDIVYTQSPYNKELLSIVKQQNKVIVSGAGLKAAIDLQNNKAKPFNRESLQINDGNLGKQGAIGILRTSDNKNNITVLMKYASQGLGHGHFDRLSIMMYNNGKEILPDYGAVRYVNILYKEGGRYLPENKSWAKQTIAHNTIVIDSSSNFGGNYKIANKYHAKSIFFDAKIDKIQLMSAKETNAYKGVNLQRTIALINDTNIFKHPVLIDVFKILSDTSAHAIDLPYYYKGQFMHSSIDYKPQTTNKTQLGNKSGYQHLWINAIGQCSDTTFKFIFMNNNKFYSLTSNIAGNNKIYFVQTGAADPNFNLRCENGLIFHLNKIKNYVFANTIECFGFHNPASEITGNLSTSVKTTNVIFYNEEYCIIKITKSDNKNVYLAITDNESKTQHIVNTKQGKFEWQGMYHLFY